MISIRPKRTFTMAGHSLLDIIQCLEIGARQLENVDQFIHVVLADSVVRNSQVVDDDQSQLILRRRLCCRLWVLGHSIQGIEDGLSGLRPRIPCR